MFLYTETSCQTVILFIFEINLWDLATFILHKENPRFQFFFKKHVLGTAMGHRVQLVCDSEWGKNNSKGAS